MPLFLNKRRRKAKNKKARKWLYIKIILVLLCLFSAYLAYLDAQIRAKMSGVIWDLPAEVYSKIETIHLSEQPTLSQTKQLLVSNGYRQTSVIAAPGDFKQQDNVLLLFRSAFAFPGQTENQRLLRLHFNNNDRLNAIEDLTHNRRVDQFMLTPKLISILQSGDEERIIMPLKHYPRLLIDMLLLTEDRSFFSHNGISPLGIIRAFIANIQAGQTVQGGSTITQQLVKNVFLTNQRSFSRKINEVLMAIIVDARYSKNKILETYLNEVYLGQNGDTQIHGFALASLFFFNRPINEISLDQIALLVGMIKGPSLYNPWRNPKNALHRRNVILSLLLEHKIIDSALYEILKNRPLRLQQKANSQQRYPAFMHALQHELKQQTNITSLSGTKIFTTLDTNQQAFAEQAIINSIADIQTRHKISDLQAAMIIVDFHNGAIRAMVGGAQTQYAGFNRAMNATRQIGSLTKPAIYLAALSQPQLFQLNTTLANQPITIKSKGSPDWQPRNYDRKFSEPVLLVDALARSMNIPTVNVGMKIGLDKVIQTQQILGWDSTDIPKVPAMLLGSYAVSPYQVTKLYQTIANAGKKVPLATLESIINQVGEIIYQRSFNPSQVVSEEASIQTLFAMQQVITLGTGRSLLTKFNTLNLAGKTGTTNDYRDSWFVGIDGNYVTTVWTGKDDNSNTKLTGATGALVVYNNYLSHANINGFNSKPLRLPTSPQIHWIGINNTGGWDCNSHRKIPTWGIETRSLCYSSQ